uniref:Uncharacterized protein n=1 Tax=Avena sativa TaxID=4498 RepID=A0ACD5VJM4_AVESA
MFPKSMPLHLLENITNGFSKDRELGSGAYARVYKGVHESGEIIAVKLLHSNPGLDDMLFEKEFRNAASLHHENIVRLVGFCHETRREYVLYKTEMIFADSTRIALCFEYMPNGSLDSYIFDECSGLDWPTRYAIIKGICEGLKYLHEELEPPLYHLDLKPANILLDDNMMPKLADFGVSRFFGQEQTQITGSCIGTFGYIPPEYIERNIISNKFDIFSLGVIIIKLITGPTGYTQCAEMPSEQFIELVHEKWRNRLQATSEDGMEQYSEQLMRCIEMALSCVENEWHRRPRIGDIIDKLNEMEAKDQGSLDQVSAQASVFAASSCTPQETTNSKAVSKAREHGWAAANAVVGVHKLVVQEGLKKAQSAIEDDARQRAHGRLAFITGELQVMQTFLYNADKGELVQNVVVRTWVSSSRSLLERADK